MRTRSVAGSTTYDVGNRPVFAFCYSTDAVGDLVYIMGDSVGGVYQVSKTDPDDPSKMPFAGIIIAKVAATDCYVQHTGLVKSLYSGLTPGAMQICGLDGRPAESLADPSSNMRIRQVMGLAMSSTDLLIRPLQPVILIPD